MSHRGAAHSARSPDAPCMRLIGPHGLRPLLYFCLIYHCEYYRVKWPKFVLLPLLPAALALLHHSGYKATGERLGERDVEI